MKIQIIVTMIGMIAALTTASATEIIFPNDPRAVIDVKRDCGAKGDGIAEDNQSAAVLLSTRNSHAGMRAIMLAGVPWSGETHVETLLVDDTHALTKTPASVDSGAKNITVDLPPHVVCLIRLSKAAAPTSQSK